MRRLLFALAVIAIGGFAFTGASPASAMTAGAVTGVNDLVKAGPEAVHWRPYYHRHYRHYRPWWGWRHRHHRNCYWRHGYRRCWY